jgi:hypothetical protein
MSIITPTSYNQAQYGITGYNVTVVGTEGSIDLFDSLLPSDILNGNSGQDLADALKIVEWISCSIIKPSLWSNTTGSSAGWTTTTPSTTRQVWQNADAPNQIP